MSEERPVWRQGFDAVERVVAPPITSLVQSEGFAIAVGLAARARRDAQRNAERATRRFLHLANLPAGSDVTRILNELGRLQAQVRELSRQVDASKEVRGDGQPAAEQQRPARARSTGR